jgi:hypothetical protein
LLVALPGWLVGLLCCALQGRFEHQGGAFAVDHHGRIYNRLWFNDGYHAAHHREPDAHWTTLAARRPAVADPISPWPPLLRAWGGVARAANHLQGAALDGLERLALHLPGLRRLLLATHRPAWRALLTTLPGGTVRHAVVVGGGLFPRTAILLAELCPAAAITVLDAEPDHLGAAGRELARRGLASRVTLTVGRHRPGSGAPCDLLVVPLAYRGDRDALYHRPPAPFTAVHDWVWRRRTARGWRVSWLLLKRLNLAVPAGSTEAPPAR